MTIRILLILVMSLCVSNLMNAQDEAEGKDEFVVNNRLPQSGSGINPTIDVTSGVYIVQTGNFNQAEVDLITPSSPSTVQIYQSGFDNSTRIESTSSRSQYYVLQKGNDNTIRNEFLVDYDGTFQYEQIGHDNLIEFELNMVNSQNIEVNQQGSNHTVRFSSETLGLPGIRITQFGDGATINVNN